MPLLAHDEYPIYQDLVQKESGRTLRICCGGAELDTINEAIRHQALLEGNPRKEPIAKKKRDSTHKIRPGRR